MLKNLPFHTSKSLSNTQHLGQLGFDNSPFANIIVSPKNGKIIMLNNAAAKLLGYSKKVLLSKTVSIIFNMTQSNFKKILNQRNVARNPTLLLAIKKDGKPIPCEMNYTFFSDENGIENVVISIEDMSRNIRKQQNIDTKNKKIVSDNIVLARSKQKKIDIKKEKIVFDNIVLARSKQKKIDIKKEKIVSDNIIIAQAKSDEEKIASENKGRKKMLIEIEENFRIMFDLSSDVLFDSDLIADSLMVNDAYEKEFGYERAGILAAEDWAAHIHPEDKKAVMKDYRRMLASAEMEWKCGYRFLKFDNSIANVLTSRIILRDATGNAFHMIGSMQDISKQKILEERLENEIRLKEVQIAEAAEDAKHTERSDIGKELHDNINQLLSASKLYLDMAKRGGENSEMYLTRSSEYTLVAIEEIRKLTKGLTTDIIKNLGLCEAIEIIVHDTMQTSPLAISCDFKDFKETSVNDKFKLNIYRIVQEQLNNILKHANATKVIINLLQDKESIKLKISDDGVGFDTAKGRKGIGVSDIKSRAISYDGIADFVSEPGRGCVLTAIFSVGNKMLISA